MTERWRPIEGFEGRYEISDQGRVRNPRTGLIRKPCGHGSRTGYEVYRLYIDGTGYSRKAHRLVAAAFIGEPTGPLVRHLDGNPKNNTLANLAYGSHADNIADSRRHGTLLRVPREACLKGHALAGDNIYLAPDGRRRCKECRTAAGARHRLRSPKEPSARVVMTPEERAAGRAESRRKWVESNREERRTYEREWGQRRRALMTPQELDARRSRDRARYQQRRQATA